MTTLLLLAFTLIFGLFSPAPAPAAQTDLPYDNASSPVDVLASYYNAINLQDYLRAYGYWETPPRAYDRFVTGFADTTQAQLIVQPPTWIDGAAGSLYASVPTVLVATHHDGSAHTYVGCFVTRKSNMEPSAMWRLYSGHLAEVAANSALPALLAQACTA